jgi:hypothetical protein
MHAIWRRLAPSAADACVLPGVAPGLWSMSQGVGRIAAITYELLPWEGQPQEVQEVDEVSTAVALVFEGETSLRFRWRLAPPSERLVLGPWEPGDPTPDSRIVNVTSRWSMFEGDVLRRLDFALHDVGAGPEPWACHLKFASGRGLVVALGELSRNGVTYLPDSLVVTASRRIGMRYQPPVALDCAWPAEG